MSAPSSTATITSIHQMTPRVKQFVLQVPGRSFDYQPGQHTVLSVAQEDDTLARPYSPVTLPGTDKLVLAIKRYEDGAMSTWMDGRLPGDTVSVGGLSGNLFLRNPGLDAAFLSTGTGITPMMAMLRHYVRAGRGHATVLYGERTQRDLMFRETLDQLAAAHPTLTVAYVLSDENWSGRTGYVQDHLDDVLHRTDGTDCYVCGVPQMVVDTRTALAERGVDDGHIYTEGWEAAATE